MDHPVGLFENNVPLFNRYSWMWRCVILVIGWEGFECSPQT